MNKKFKSLLLSIAFVSIAAAALFAANKVIEFAAKVDFESPMLVHEQITNVSSISKKLNAGVKVDYGMFSDSNAKAELVYKFDGSSSVETVTRSGIKDDEQFFIATDVGDHNSIEYQIKVSFENSDGTVYDVYSPEDKSFYNATISNSVSDVVGSEGGKVEYDSGNQENGKTGVNFKAGTFEDGTEIVIEELDLSGISPVSSYKSVSKVSASSYGKFGTPISGINVYEKSGKKSWSPAADGYIGLKGATGSKFTVVYREDDTADISTWEVIDTEKVEEGSVYSKVSKAGEYLVFTGSELAGKSHKPIRRTIVKGRIGLHYPGFEFPNLKEGDVLKIFNVNGKKIREISSGNNMDNYFVWDGRKDGGEWAKSGIYIYQIKVKETGKLVSGTIVFVY